MQLVNMALTFDILVELVAGVWATLPWWERNKCGLGNIWWHSSIPQYWLKVMSFMIASLSGFPRELSKVPLIPCCSFWIHCKIILSVVNLFLVLFNLLPLFKFFIHLILGQTDLNFSDSYSATGASWWVFHFTYKFIPNIFSCNFLIYFLQYSFIGWLFHYILNSKIKLNIFLKIWLERIHN